MVAFTRTFSFASVVVTLLAAPSAFSQGCIVARSSTQFSGPESGGGYMSKGEFDFSIGLRHQFSFRHFVGDVEQTQRQVIGNQVMNKVNLLNYNLTYQATNRFSFTVNAPMLLASRRSNNSPYTTTAQGLGDIIVGVQGWIWDPRENSKGNIQIGLGASLPSGRSDLKNQVDSFNGKGLQDVVLDYSIQPGSGGYGLTLNWQAFKNLGSTQTYFNGSYIATPQNYNNTRRSSTSTNVLTMYNSISDQYLLEAGAAHAVPHIKGLSVSFGPRWEGVPAKDLIGESLGFRRPGFALSLAPGVQYIHGRHLFTGTYGRAILRDRTRSVPDRISGGHGDAAFADNLWLASYSFRFGGRGKNAHAGHAMDVPDKKN